MRVSLVAIGSWTTSKDGPVIGLTTVRIIGPSMEPVMRNQEVYLAVTRVRVRVGDVVLLRHPDRHELVTAKRVVRRVEGGWWVEGDNLPASTDSRQFGPIGDDLILGRIAFRLQPLRRRG